MPNDDSAPAVHVGTFGHIEEFLPGSTTWKQYSERLDFYFLANNITEDSRKRNIFLSVCGQALFSVCRSVCTPDSLKNVSYDTLVDKLDAHFTPKPSETLCRHKFHKRDQLPNESISEFLAAIRRLSEHCKFGTMLNSFLRDRLVCGLRDLDLQRRLFSVQQLDLQDAIDAALAAEAAAQHTLEVRGSSSNPSDVHFVKSPKSNNSAAAKQINNFKHPCYRCGDRHPIDQCKFRNATCHFCKKVGHIAIVCNSKKKNAKPVSRNNKSTKVHSLGNDFSQRNICNLSTVGEFPPNDIKVKLNGLDHLMEIDSGSLHSVLSSSTLAKLWPENPPTLKPASNELLRTWSLEPLQIIGSFNVEVKYNGRTKQLPLLVLQGQGKSLIGRTWFNDLGIKIVLENPNPIHLVTNNSVEAILKRHQNVFRDELGTFRGPPVTIRVNEGVTPRFLRARQAPFALRERVSEELDNMVKKGIVEPISYSEWATPIVPVLKKNNSIRICGDYRSTVNQAVKHFTYPLPTVNEVLSTVAGGTIFSKLDLSDAYLQLPVDEATSKLLTLNTHKGLFRVKRLPFGVSVSGAIFQQRMEQVFAGLQGVLPYYDDTFVKGDGLEDHNKKLEEVLNRLEREGIRLRREKCSFVVPDLELLGFRVNARGVQPTDEKVKAIHQAPTPTNVTELQAFLGLLNFYGCFLKNRSNVLEPLHRLLQKDVPWLWTPIHDQAFQGDKELLRADDLLVHYDEKLPLLLTCDASAYGIGSVLSQVKPDGKEAPIAYDSRSLAKAEKNYSQTDKEALAIVSSLLKFRQYLTGRKFKIVTDHKPLLGLFNPAKPIPQMLSPRVLRWSLLLAAHDYELEYRKGKEIPNADGLSRLPVLTPDFEIPSPADILLLESRSEIPINADLIATSTRKDPLLSRVSLCILNGWPCKSPDDRFAPFFKRRDELSVHKDCILWGSRVLIPESLQQEVLTLLHGSHPGIVRMKGLARSYVWWPNMDAQIESTVNACTTCQETRRFPAKAPIHPWEWTEQPWSRLHIDYAGPFHGQTFLLVVDSHSKWLEVVHVNSMSANTAIGKLRQIFSTHGLPDTIVSDNAVTFTSEEFKDFLRKNQIRQEFVAPYHPSSNGQAERMVATTKESLKRIVQGEWQLCLARFLFSQHTLPCTTTGKSPAELLMNRRLRTLLDRLHPDLNKTMRNKQKNEAATSQAKKRTRSFETAEPVFIRSYTPGPVWTPATIVQPTGPVSHRTQSSDGSISNRHLDQIRRRVDPTMNETSQETEADIPETMDTTASAPDSPVHDPPTPRRAGRTRLQPRHLKDYVLHLARGGVSCTDDSTERLRSAGENSSRVSKVPREPRSFGRVPVYRSFQMVPFRVYISAPGKK